MHLTRFANAAALFLMMAAIDPLYPQERKENPGKPPEKQQSAQPQQQQRTPPAQQKQAQPQQAQPAPQRQAQPQQAQRAPQQQRPQPQQQAQPAPQRQAQPQQAQRAPQQQQPQQPQHAQPAQTQPRQPAQQAQRSQMPQPQQQRTQQQASAWQQKRGWAPQGAWQAHTTWQQGGSARWENDHRTWAERGGYGGSYIPQASFALSFGSGHSFRLRSVPTMYMGYPRFYYGGYSFLLVDPFPGSWTYNWYDSDDLYITYDDGYYLYDRRYPGVGLAITVVL